MIAYHWCRWEMICFYSLFTLDLGLHCLLDERRSQPNAERTPASYLPLSFPGHRSWRWKGGFRDPQEWFWPCMIFTASFLSQTRPPWHLQSCAYTQKQGGSSGVTRATPVEGASHPCLLPVGEVVWFLLNREGGRLRVSLGSEGQARIKPNPIRARLCLVMGMHVWVFSHIFFIACWPANVHKRELLCAGLP